VVVHAGAEDVAGGASGSLPRAEGATVSLASVLEDEHKVIERVLTALEEAAGKVERGQAVRAGFFLEAADFVRGFADGCHHKKEEGILFPAMMAHGFR